MSDYLCGTEKPGGKTPLASPIPKTVPSKGTCTTVAPLQGRRLGSCVPVSVERLAQYSPAGRARDILTAESLDSSAVNLQLSSVAPCQEATLLSS